VVPPPSPAPFRRLLRRERVHLRFNQIGQGALAEKRYHSVLNKEIKVYRIDYKYQV